MTVSHMKIGSSPDFRAGGLKCFGEVEKKADLETSLPSGLLRCGEFS